MALNDLIFRHGKPLMVDYVPGADVPAGSVVVFGTSGLCCGVAHAAIPANTLGALAVGGGVYQGINLDNANVGAKVYWDDTNKKLTTTSTSNALVGFVGARGGGGADSACDVVHEPYV